MLKEFFTLHESICNDIFTSVVAFTRVCIMLICEGRVQNVRL